MSEVNFPTTSCLKDSHANKEAHLLTVGIQSSSPESEFPGIYAYRHISELIVARAGNITANMNHFTGVKIRMKGIARRSLGPFSCFALAPSLGS